MEFPTTRNLELMASSNCDQSSPPNAASPPVLPTPMEQLWRIFALWWKKFYDSWFDMQLIHCGCKYSIERMLALEEYTKTTSLTRVVFLTIGLPILIVVLILCQESIPLQKTTEGWKANYGFWIRVALVGIAIAQAVGNKIEPWLQVPSLSRRQTVAYCFIVGGGHVVVGMIIAEFWFFPIPFFMLVMSSVSSALIIGGLRVVVGARTFRLINSQKSTRRRMNLVSGLQALMGTVYPAYEALFNKANHTQYELPVIMLLPVFKLVMKALFVRVASHKEDMIPEQVIFTVDFFDAFYLATFMQSLSSSTIAVVLAVDLLQTAIELQELHQRTQNVLIQLRKAVEFTDSTDDGDIMTILRLLCSTKDALRKQIRSKIKVRSCIHHELSHEGRMLLQDIENEPTSRITSSSTSQSTDSSIEKPFRASRIWFKQSPRKIATIQPLSVTSTATNSTEKLVERKSSSRALEEALRVLFASECIVLTEYLEVFVPVLYGTFILIMVDLPSSKYHTEMENVTRGNVGTMVGRIFIYALLEFVSFVIFAVITKRNCGIRVLYQLAFVLETQMASVLTKVMLWLLVTLTYRVAHFGVDFSFQFTWIKAP